VVSRDAVNRHEAYVVAVPGIFAARIAKAHKEFHRIRLFKSGSLRLGPGPRMRGPARRGKGPQAATQSDAQPGRH
jgi:hypothetical protein